MARKRTIMDDLVLLPWWVCLILAAIVYIVLKYWIPSIEFTNPYTNMLKTAAPSIAPMFAFVAVFAGIISAIKSWERGELLDSQTSIKSITDLSWKEFEVLIGEAFRRKDYTVIENDTAGPDGGIDVVLIKDDHKTLVQCKNWRTSKVGVKVVRELLGVMTSKSADFGIVVCSGLYTNEAMKFARENKIELIGAKELTELIGSVQKEKRVKQNPTSNNISCPFCKSPMVRRTAKRGQQAGNVFYGCSTYPKCKGIRSI